MQKLTISEALTLLEDGRYHEVAYVSANNAKQEGGRIIRIKECQIIPHHNKHVAKDLPVTPVKSQAHSLNATRNLHLRNGLIRKMHIYLLFHVDKIPVL